MLTTFALSDSLLSVNLKGEKNMNRIDVVPADKGKFQVLVNFIRHGVELSSSSLANQTAAQIKSALYPAHELHLANETVGK